MSSEYEKLLNALPRPDLYDSWELVKRHMPIEQPPSAASYIVFQKGGQCYAKNGTTGHIEFGPGDAASVIQSAINALASGGKIFIKSGIYSITNAIVPVSYLTIFGEGGATVLKLAPDANVSILKTTTKIREFALSYITLDGNKTAQSTATPLVDLYIPQSNSFFRCRFSNSKGKGLYFHGDPAIEYGYDNRVINSSFGSNDEQDIHTSFCDGNFFINNWFDSTGLEAIRSTSGSDRIIGNYFCKSSRLDATTFALYIEGPFTVALANHFDSINGGGIRVAGAGEGRIVAFNKIGSSPRQGIRTSYTKHTLIIGNQIVNPSGEASNTYDGIYVEADENMQILGNFIVDYRSSPMMRYGIYHPSWGSPVRYVIKNNFISGYVTGAIRLYGSGHIVKDNVGYVTENSGTATFSGNGTTTTFTIAHGLAGTPISWRVEAGSSDAKGDKYVTANATNLTVTFATAPPSGTNNVVLIWEAEM
jgi:hypothetical protein